MILFRASLSTDSRFSHKLLQVLIEVFCAFENLVFFSQTFGLRFQVFFIKIRQLELCKQSSAPPPKGSGFLICDG